MGGGNPEAKWRKQNSDWQEWSAAMLSALKMDYKEIKKIRCYGRQTTNDRRRTNSNILHKWLRWHDVCLQIFHDYSYNASVTNKSQTVLKN